MLLKENIPQEVQKIRNSPGKDIWLFGGASLATSLMNEGLVDEISLSVHPILLGSGKPLFSNIKERASLELIGSKTYQQDLFPSPIKYGEKAASNASRCWIVIGRLSFSQKPYLTTFRSATD